MKILGIENRTENWRTAYYFSPFFRDEDARLRLARRLGEPAETQASDVHINLFWEGMRDYLSKGKIRSKNNDSALTQDTVKDLANRYKRLFIEKLDLRTRIEEFIKERRQAGEPRFQDLKNWNYLVSEPTSRGKSGAAELSGNLNATEIDVVLSSSNHLFIGEAKYESTLVGSSKYVLVHQLIRQYVMARIRENPDGREQAQVYFMIKQDWLKEKNVLTWEQIKKLAEG